MPEVKSFKVGCVFIMCFAVFFVVVFWGGGYIFGKSCIMCHDQKPQHSPPDLTDIYTGTLHVL